MLTRGIFIGTTIVYQLASLTQTPLESQEDVPAAGPYVFSVLAFAPQEPNNIAQRKSAGGGTKADEAAPWDIGST